jgi:PilZ domain-containing protein
MERREFHRIGFVTKAEISNAHKKWETETQKVSLNGVQVKCPPHWTGKIDEHYTLTFPIQDPNVPFKMQMQTKITSQDDNHIGFTIEHIDLDSLSHLTRLIELHLGDPELMAQELAKINTKKGQT